MMPKRKEEELERSAKFFYTSLWAAKSRLPGVFVGICHSDITTKKKPRGLNLQCTSLFPNNCFNNSGGLMAIEAKAISHFNVI